MFTEWLNVKQSSHTEHSFDNVQMYTFTELKIAAYEFIT